MGKTHAINTIILFIEWGCNFSYSNVATMPVPVAARSKAEVCGRSPVEIVGSNPTEDMDVCLL